MKNYLIIFWKWTKKQDYDKQDLEVHDNRGHFWLKNCELISHEEQRIFSLRVIKRW